MSFRIIFVAIILPASAVFAKEVDKKQLARDIDEVIVIGRMKDAGIPRVPLTSIGSRNVFGPDDIKETGARTLNDLINHIPALSTRPYNGGEAAAPSFSMRGLPDDGLTEFIHVVIDGVPANSLPYGWTAFSFMPITPERIHAIDYLRGAHTVRYSPDTVGGVLNFITHPIPRKRTVRTQVTIGDDGFLSALLQFGETRGRLGYLATYVKREGDGYREDGDWRQEDAALKVRYEIDERSWVAGSFGNIQDEHKAPGGLTLAQFDSNRFGNARPLNEFDGYRTNADVLYHRDLDDTAWVEGFADGALTKRHLRAERPRFGTATTVNNWTDSAYFFAIGVRAEKKIGGHTLYGGLRFHREWISNWSIDAQPLDGAPATPLLRSSFYLSAFSAHIDDTFHLLEDRLTVQVGVRLEWVADADGHDDLSGFDFEDDFFTALPGIGVVYEITRKLVVFGNYFEGFRAPQVFGFGSTRPGDDLDFEDSSIAEAGLRWENLRGASGAVTAWRTVYDDFHLFTSDGFFEDLGRIEAYGVDFEFDWQVGEVWERLEGFSILGSLTLQNSELKRGADRGNDTPYAWREKAAWRLRYEREGWLASIGGTYVGSSYSDSPNTRAESPDGQIGRNRSRALWDARVGKTTEISEAATLEVAGGLTNLFDKDWSVHSRGGFFGGGKVAGPPRQGYVTFNLTVRW